MFSIKWKFEVTVHGSGMPVYRAFRMKTPACWLPVLRFSELQMDWQRYDSRLRNARLPGIPYENAGLLAASPGIYLVKGAALFRTQLIVSRALDKSSHVWIKALTDKMQKQDMDTTVKETLQAAAGRSRKLSLDIPASSSSMPPTVSCSGAGQLSSDNSDIVISMENGMFYSPSFPLIPRELS